MDSDESLETILADAITWCEQRASLDDPKECLRSHSLRPSPLEQSRAEVVSSVCGGRRFDSRHSPSADVPRERGRLLVLAPDLDTRCGSVEGESRGFFDIFATPPWDTWLVFLEPELDGALNSSEVERLEKSGANRELPLLGCLVSYVPVVLVDLVQRAIEVDPMGCLGWLDDCPSWFAPELRSLVSAALQPEPIAVARPKSLWQKILHR